MAQIKLCMDPRDVSNAVSLITSSSPPTYLELFNEPDFSYMGITPLTSATDAAAALAPLFQAKTSTTFVGPGLADPNSGWLTQFNDACGKCIDKSIPIMSMHIYSNSTDGVISSIEKFHSTWPSKKIWITELAPSSDPTGQGCIMSEADVIKWMQTVVPRIVKLGYVDRIFWNSGEYGTLMNTSGPKMCDSSLTNADGSATELLKAYSKICS
ncbi:hypothetical protein MMC24_005581 [Lignoscripta atroalba]|nr:hypothetical protein [Lignoscripta atroalba]